MTLDPLGKRKQKCSSTSRSQRFAQFWIRWVDMPVQYGPISITKPNITRPSAFSSSPYISDTHRWQKAHPYKGTHSEFCLFVFTKTHLSRFWTERRHCWQRLLAILITKLRPQVNPFIPCWGIPSRQLWFPFLWEHVGPTVYLFSSSPPTATCWKTLQKPVTKIM